MQVNVYAALSYCVNPPAAGTPEASLSAAAARCCCFPQVDAYAALPYFMNPLLAACQLVNVAVPGSEPKLAEAKEDMRLFSPALADKNSEYKTATTSQLSFACLLALSIVVVGRQLVIGAALVELSHLNCLKRS
jgi:hypothetical protein